MSFNQSTYSNKIIINDKNDHQNTSISNNIDSKKYLFFKSSQIINFCNDLSEINSQNENGYTPIYLSVLSNNIQALKELISLEADIDIPNNLNETPLYLSVNKNNFDAFLILMKYKADCNIQNIKGDTPLHIAVQKKEKKFIEMLLTNNSNPNIQNFTLGQTPTHLAIINKMDEDILKLFKKYKANVFHIKDKLLKTPFDYAKEINDENYLNLLLKIFGYNHFTNNGLDEVNNTSMEDFKNSPQNKENTALNKCNYNINSFQDKEIKEFSHSNTNSINMNNGDYYILTNETNKNEFKMDNCESNKDRIISNNSLRVNKIILSSDISSENIQIKELNSSIDNNLYKIKKSLTEFIPEEKLDKINIKGNLELNNNNLSQMYNQNGIRNILPKTKSHREFSRNSDNIKTKTNMIIGNSNYSNNYSHNSNNSENNSHNNMYMTNSVGANKKIIKNIIRDTIKKILVKSISSSDENTSNANCLSKESDKLIQTNSNMEDTKKTKNNNLINNKKNINIIDTKDNINNEKLISEKNSYNSNELKTNNNLYENGTSSYYLLNTKNVNDIMDDDNITVSKLIPKESKTINILDDNNIFPNNQNNEIDFKENENLEIKENKFSETTNSNIFSDLQIKSNIIEKTSSNQNENTSNNIEKLSNNDEITLSYSKNLQNEEDEIQIKLIENKIDKKLQEIKNENNLELNLDNSNLDIKIYDNQSNFGSKNNDIVYINSKISQKENSNNTYNINEDIHEKNISNGNLINSNKQTKKGIDSYNSKETKYKYKQKTFTNYTIDNYMDISEDLNGINNKTKELIFNKNKFKNKSQIYLNRRKQLSYHLNINNSLREKDNKYSNEMFMTNVANTINVNDYKENENPNKISIINQKVYKNKNNIISKWYNINSNRSFKNSINSKNSNNIIMTNRGSKISLTKSGSSQNMNPPPIGGYMLNKDICISPSNNSFASINNINTGNSNSNNKKQNQNKSSINNNIFMNNTVISTNKPKHSTLNKIENHNNNININLKNIPIKNNINNKIHINPYAQKNNLIKNNNLINTYYDSEESSNNINNKLRNISTEELLKLRDFLISCDLLCYYNLLISKNFYHIDLYIKDIQRNIIPLTYNDLEEIGIKKPGHIYRILIKLEIDAGIINNDLFSYITDKINFNSITSTLAMTSSVNGIFCCGIRLCPNDNYNNKKRIKNNSIYFNDLNSFLRVNDIIRLKGNFIHNGFDRIEFIVIQQFTKYAFDKKILNEHLHIYIDRDKIKLLNLLQMIKNNLSNEFGLNFGTNEEYKNNDLNQNQKQANEVIEFSYDKNNNVKENIFYNEDINPEFNEKEEKDNNSHFCNIF